MNFEELYEKCQNGTATEDEKRQLEAEINKAKSALDFVDKNETDAFVPPVKEAEDTAILKSRKKFKKSVLTTWLVATICAVLLATGAVLGGVFGSAASYAHSAKRVSRDQATTLAQSYAEDFVADNYSEFSPYLLLVDFDDHLVVTPVIKDSYYAYYVHFKADIPASKAELEITIKINSRSQEISLLDVDKDLD